MSCDRISCHRLAFCVHRVISLAQSGARSNWYAVGRFGLFTRRDRLDAFFPAVTLRAKRSLLSVFTTPRAAQDAELKGSTMKKAMVSICLCFMLTCSAYAASSRQDLQARIDAAKTVMDEIMAAQDRSIPMNILEDATCVAVVPGLVKGAFVFGGQYGQGVVTCRTGHGWSAPVFIRMAGGSFGFQIGGQSTDLVLVAVNDHGLQDLLKSKFKIGGDASAAAGPVGRSGQAATDWKMNAELLSYSRNKGLFAGIDLDGTSVSQNRKTRISITAATTNSGRFSRATCPYPTMQRRLCAMWPTTLLLQSTTTDASMCD